MQIIFYKCDFCPFEQEYHFSPGSMKPRILHNIGPFEACDDCKEKALKLLRESLGKKKEEEDERYLADCGVKDGKIICRQPFCRSCQNKVRKL